MLRAAGSQSAPSGDRPGILDRLRHETRDLHEAVERDVDLDRCLASREAYRALLGRWWGFLCVSEPALGVILDPTFFEPRRKIELLRGDLQRLGSSDADIGSLPRCNAKMPYTEAEALGAVYVIEGSTLGGRIIARRAVQALGADVPVSFFHPYGPKSGAMWRDSHSAIAERSSPYTDDIIVASARTTFEQLCRWLCHKLV